MKYLSVFDNDSSVIVALKDIFLRGKNINLDCTYSKGIFYKSIEEPILKSDIVPLFDDVSKDDSRELKNINDESLTSIVFDPPFLFRNRKAVNNDKMCKRFSYFKSYDELIEMYARSLQCFYRKLKKGGYVFFKCQDMTDGKFYATHKAVIDIAESVGFTLKDIAIKTSKSKLQRDAKQQNCVAKVHSYWIVLKKG